MDNKRVVLLAAICSVVLFLTSACGNLLVTSDPVIVSGRIWEDFNFNGIQDPGEPPLPGVEVQLWRMGPNASGTRSAPVERILSTDSDENGEYFFAEFPEGDYVVIAVKPEGYAISPSNVGNDDNVDSDFERSLVQFSEEEISEILSEGDLSELDEATISLVVVEKFLAEPVFFIDETDEGLQGTRDLGLVQVFNIGDQVWIDANGNGIQDEPDSNDVPAVKVILYRFNEESGEFEEIEHTTTGKQGSYKFFDQLAGTYKLQFVLPSGYEATLPDQVRGELDLDAEEVDSDIDRLSWETSPFEVNSRDAHQIDAGLIRLSMDDSILPPVDIPSILPPSDIPAFGYEDLVPNADEPNDVAVFSQFLCATVEVLSDPIAFLRQVRIAIAENRIHLTGFYAAPGPPDDFSSAVIIAQYDAFGTNTSSYGYQIHDGIVTQGEVDAQGNFMQSDNLGIFRDTANAYLAMTTPFDPSTVAIEVETYRTAQEGDERTCSFFFIPNLTMTSFELPGFADTSAEADSDSLGDEEQNPTAITGETTTPEGIIVTWTVYQEDGQLFVNYTAVDADGNALEGDGFATTVMKDENPGGPGATHASGAFSESGSVELVLELINEAGTEMEPGTEMDLWIFIPRMDSPIVLTDFTVAD